MFQIIIPLLLIIRFLPPFIRGRLLDALTSVPIELTEDRFQVQMDALNSKLLVILSTIKTFLGFGTMAVNLRTLIDNEARFFAKKRDPRRSTVEIIDTTFDNVKARVYLPKKETNKSFASPAILYFHGGGYTIASVELYDPVTFRLANKLEIPVISIEYRLAPEHVFPAAFDDCMTAAVWLIKKGTAEYRIDPEQITIAGDSSGGNLAAAVTQELVLNKKLPVKHQILIYPTLQMVDCNLPSFQQNRNIETLTDYLLATFIGWYLLGNDADKETAIAICKNEHIYAHARKLPIVADSLSHDLIPVKMKKARGYRGPVIADDEAVDKKIADKFDSLVLNPNLNPFRANLRGLPPAYILTAEFDILRDDGYLYSRRLEEAGVKVTLKNYEQGFHGVFNQSHTKTGRECVNDLLRYIKENIID